MTIVKSLLNERNLLLTQEKLLVERITALKKKRDEFRGGGRQEYTRTIGQAESELDGTLRKLRVVDQSIQSWADKHPELMGR